jgi:hypothetical protein
MKTFTAALPLLFTFLIPLATANKQYYIGYANDSKITWEEGQDTCMADYQTLVGKASNSAPSQSHASACNMAFQVTDEKGSTVKLAYTNCRGANDPIDVSEVDRVSGAPIRQVGSCVVGYKETGKQTTHECGFFDQNIWDGNTGHDAVVEWTCEIAL